MGEIVNKHKLAAILGKTERWLTILQDQGMPIHAKGKRGTSNEYDTAHVIEWLIARETGGVDKSSLEQEQMRLTKANASLAELKLQEQQGVLVRADETQLMLESMVLRMRAKMLALPTKLAALALGAKEFAEVEAAARTLINEVLTEIAHDNQPPDMGDSAGGAGESGPASESDGEPVGGPLPKAKRRSKRGAGAVEH